MPTIKYDGSDYFRVVQLVRDGMPLTKACQVAGVPSKTPFEVRLRHDRVLAEAFCEASKVAMLRRLGYV
jgi:hypothetical protein